MSIVRYILLGEKKDAGKTKKFSFLQRRKHRLTFGQRAADKLTRAAGSWAFIIGLFIYISTWALLNLAAFMQHWDPYPFILLNLVLSCLAAVQAPIILMSQNRAADRDRRKAEEDFRLNKMAEREIENIQKELNEIKRMLQKKVK